MGKGRIVSAQGEGLYTIEILEDRARAESSRAMAVQRVAELDQRISDAEDELPALQQAVDDAAQAQDQAIALHQQQLADDGESDVDLAAYAVAVMEAAASRDRKRIEIGQMQADRLALQTRIERIDALPPLRQVEAWCADYTEDLQGEVATAEVPGEVGQVIIKPGFDGNTWSAATDGAMQPALSGTPAGVFYNLAMLPGWQKWRPTFRIATISNIANDTADIDLIPAASSQQGLNVNMASAYDGVPIMYMDCNGDAFEDGDRVLVAFSGNTGEPMVVGFEQEPRMCNPEYKFAFSFTEQFSYWTSMPEVELTTDANGEPVTNSAESRVTSSSMLPYPVPYLASTDPDVIEYVLDSRDNVSGAQDYEMVVFANNTDVGKKVTVSHAFSRAATVSGGTYVVTRQSSADLLSNSSVVSTLLNGIGYSTVHEQTNSGLSSTTTLTTPRGSISRDGQALGGQHDISQIVTELRIVIDARHVTYILVRHGQGTGGKAGTFLAILPPDAPVVRASNSSRWPWLIAESTAESWDIGEGYAIDVDLVDGEWVSIFA